MINRKIALILLGFMQLCGRIYAQGDMNDLKKYLVFTFEVKHKGSKIKSDYYWIVPRDSINKEKLFKLSPLYTQDYSKDLLERCKGGQAIDIFSYSTSTDFRFDEIYKETIKNLLSLLTIHRVKIQSFSKKWEEKQHNEEDIKVYATPVSGVFCHCLQGHGKVTYGFKGLAYLPVAAFSYDEGFWTDKLGYLIKYLDYSYIAYSSHYPSSIHGNSNIRVEAGITLFK